MTRHALENYLADLVDHVQLFFAKKGKKEGLKELRRHSLGVLREINHMDKLIAQNPSYVAIAFLDKIKFENCPHIKELSEGVSEDLFQKIQGKRSFRVAKSAEDAWNYIVSKNQIAACAILALCYLFDMGKID